MDQQCINFTKQIPYIPHQTEKSNKKMTVQIQKIFNTKMIYLYQDDILIRLITREESNSSNYGPETQRNDVQPTIFDQVSCSELFSSLYLKIIVILTIVDTIRDSLS